MERSYGDVPHSFFYYFFVPFCSSKNKSVSRKNIGFRCNVTFKERNRPSILPRYHSCIITTACAVIIAINRGYYHHMISTVITSLEPQNISNFNLVKVLMFRQRRIFTKDGIRQNIGEGIAAPP